MTGRFKKLIKGEKKIFYDLCRTNNLNLDYEGNLTELSVLESVFINREYSDYFPFYQNVTIVDIGAHFGYFSLFAACNSGKDSKIIAVEPDKRNYKQLEKNISDCNADNISIFNYAAGDRSGHTRLYQGKNPNHSIVPGYLLLDRNPDFDEVEVKTLEEIVRENNLTQIDFLKMDCEGAEYTIIESTPDTILDRIKTISMEFHDLKDENVTAENIIGKLIENGFGIVKYCYEKTTRNLNYGKIIGTKMYNPLVDGKR